MRAMSDGPIPAGVRIGHVHLKVADIERSLAFYCGVLGFELMQRFGREAAFVSAGGYHHHIAINTWESAGGDPPPPGTAGRASLQANNLIRMQSVGSACVPTTVTSRAISTALCFR